MEINTDGRTGQALLPGQAERRLSEVRQGRWLYELEQALLVRSDKKPAPAAPPREEASADAQASGQDAGDSLSARQASARTPQAGSGGHDTSQRAALATPAAARADGGDTAAAGAQAGETAAAAAAAASTAPAPEAAPLGAPDDDGQSSAGVAAAAQQMSVATPLTPLMPLAAYAAASAVGQLGASPATAAGAAQAMRDSPEPMAAGVNWMAAPADEEAAPSPESAAPETEQEHAPASAARAAEPADDYASRLLHVYQGADGVQAWVRDTSLSAAQSVLLARGMADQLDSVGSRLSALTVNGKKILSDSDNLSINSTGAV